MRRGTLFIGIISLLIATAGKSQSLVQIREYADRQLEAGKTRTTLKEYQRVLLFDEGNSFPELFERIASIYYSLNEFTEAIHYYDLAWRASPTDSIRLEMTFRKTLCYFRRQEFLLALTELYDLPEPLSPHFRFKQEIYLGICQFGLNEIPSSLEHFAGVLDTTDYVRVEALLNEYQEFREKYDPDRLETMSIILPGLGQLYGGEPGTALNSVGLLAAIGAYSYYTTLQYSLLDGLLIFGSLFYRYYSGGHKKAYEIGERLLVEKQSATYQELLNLVRTGPATSQ